MKLTAVLSLQDNYTDVLKKATRETLKFRGEVDKTKKALDATFHKKYKLNVDIGGALGSLGKLKSPLFALANFKVNIKLQINPFSALKALKGTSNAAKSLATSPFKMTLKLVDLVTGPLKGIKDVMANSLKGAASLEQTSMVVEHMIAVNNKGFSGDKVKEQAAQYMKDFRTQPELAAFDTKDVQDAGEKAIAVSSGDTQEATNLLRLSADMAALTPGKSLTDALEALSELRKGDADALKDFNFDVDEASIKSAGNDMGKVKNKKGIALSTMYKGGGSQKAQTADGLMTGAKNSLKNSLADMGKETLGVLKPEIQKLMNFLNGDSARKMFSAGSRMIAGLAKAVFAGVHAVQSWISSRFLNNIDFQNLPDIKSKILYVFGELKGAFDGWYENSGKGMISGFFSGLVSNGVELLLKAIPMFLETALKIGVAIAEGIGSGLKILGSKGLKWFKGVVGWDDKEDKDSDVKDAPKRAIGLSRVPYDNYPVLLHQNERVLTAQEARSVDNRTPVTINLVAGKQVDPDIGRLMGALKTAVESAGFNMAPGGATA
jgi:hypothetical protein